MTHAAELPAWAALATAAFVLVGAMLTFTGTLGLLRFRSFYERVHAPTLGTTLGMACILIASSIFFSVLRTRPVLHELLIAVFVTTTTPVTLVLLVRATLYRDRSENAAGISRPDTLSEGRGPGAYELVRPAGSRSPEGRL